MENLPVLDQGTAGICYAYTAAQMIDAYRFAHGDKRKGHLTSPLQMAALYKARYPNSTEELSKRDDVDALSGGVPITSVSEALLYGSCSKKRSDELQNSSNLDLKIARLIALYKAKDYPNETIDKIANSVLCEFDIETKAEPKMTSLLKSIKNALELKSEQDFIYELMNTMCSQPYKIEIKPPAKIVSHLYSDSHTTGGNTEAVLKFLRNAFNSNPKTPAAISYCSNILRDKNYTGGIASSYFQTKLVCKRRHGSIVIGRRLNSKTNTCQYLVQNTWGSSCNPYPDHDCENGSVWIDEKQLTENTYEIFRLEKQ